MKKGLIKLVVFSFAIVATESVLAFAKTMYPYELPAGKQGAGLGCEIAKSGMKLELGKWYTNFEVCKKYADDNGLPLFCIWSNWECVHCWYTDIVLIQDSFREWQRENNAGQVVCCFMAGEKNNAGLYDQPNSPVIKGLGCNAYNWMWKNGGTTINAYPFVVLWWKKNGVNKRYDGDTFCGSKTFNDTTIPLRVENAKAKLEDAFKDWVPPAPVASYSGGYFTTSNTVMTCMQAEPSTKWIEVPVARKATVATNQVLYVRNGRTNREIPFVWAENTVATNVLIDSFDTTVYKCGVDIALELRDGDKVVSETIIRCVDTVPNGTENPYWIGEKTAAELQWGDWTMDYEVALQKAKAGGGSVLGYIEGALWCPYCFWGNSNFLSRVEFKNWCTANKVVCVQIDFPRVVNDKEITRNCCLLTRDIGKCSFVGVSPQISCGAGYLSRKMIPQGEAEACFSRNLDIGTNLWIRAEDVDEKRAAGLLPRHSMGYLSLIDADGNIKGRLNWKHSTSSSTIDGGKGNLLTEDEFQANLRRLDELYTVLEEDAEEDNQNWRTTREVIAMRDVKSGTISACDRIDTFRVEPSAKGSLVQFTFTPDAAANSYRLKLIDVDAVTGKETELQVRTSTSESVSVSAVIPSTNTYLVVQGVGDKITDTFFGTDQAITNVASLRAYTVTSASVLIPQEGRGTYALPDGESQVVFQVVSGEVYRVENIVAKPGEFVEISPCFYRAEVTGQIVVDAQEGATEIAFQSWKSASYGFSVVTKTVEEDAGTVTVSVRRNGGASGSARVRVTLDKELTNLYDVYEIGGISYTNYLYSFETQELTWSDGDAADKDVYVTVIDDVYFAGGGKVVLNLEIVDSEAGDATLTEGFSQFVLVVTENDRQDPGEAIVSGTDPEFEPTRRVVYVKEDDDLTLQIERVGGSEGRVGVVVVANDGGVVLSGGDGNDDWEVLPDDLVERYSVGKKAGIQYWSNRNGGVRKVKVSNLPAAGTTFRILLEELGNSGEPFLPIKGSDYVTVVTVAAVAPDFQVAGSEEMTLHRYVSFEERVFPLNGSFEAPVSLSKLSGALPAGLKAVYDKSRNALVISGRTTAKPGRYPVTYRAKVANVAGVPKTIFINVDDPTNPELSPGSANPSVAVTRSFADIPVEKDGRLVGVLSLTIPTRGNVSARLVGTNGTVSLSAKCWSGFNAENRDLVAELVGKNDWTMHFTAGADYSVTASIDNGGEIYGFVSHNGIVWNRNYSAADFAGYYTTVLGDQRLVGGSASLAPTGFGYLALKMNTASAYNKGKMTFAGVLPNGTSVSGSSTLKTDSEGFAVLPVFNRSSSDILSGEFSIAANAVENENRMCVKNADDIATFWRHIERKVDGFEYEYGVYGSYFKPNQEDLLCCCNECYADGGQEAQDEMVLEFKVDNVVIANVGVGSRTIKVLADNPNSVSIAYRPATGLISGTFKNDGRTYGYKGIVLPGWGGVDCGCTPGGSEFKPFVCGAYFDRVGGIKTGGRVDVDHAGE